MHRCRDNDLVPGRHAKALRPRHTLTTPNFIETLSYTDLTQRHGDPVIHGLQATAFETPTSRVYIEIPFILLGHAIVLRIGFNRI